MQSVKQESNSFTADVDCNDDEWLSYWSNDKDKVKAEDLKPDKIKVEDNERENFVSQLKKSKDKKISKSGQKDKRTEACTEAVGKNKSQSETFDVNTVERIYKNPCKHGNRHQCPSLKEALVNAPVSETILNLCKYQCPKCRKIYMSRPLLSRHLKKTHAFIDQGCFTKYLVKIIAHQCKNCHKKLLCDRTTILSHIRHKHKVKILNKHSDKNCPEDYEQTARKKMKLKKMFSEIGSQCITTSVVGNLCNFICRQCNYTTKSWKILRRHIKRENHLPILPPMKHVQKLMLHKCHLCQQLLFCDLYMIGYHITSNHKHTINEYRKRVKIQNCDKPHLQYLLELRPLIQDIPAAESRLPYALQSKGLPEDSVTNNVGNICFFQCPKCDKSFSSYGALYIHSRADHDFTKISFERNVVEARYHRCSICKMCIACDNEFVYRHVKWKHNLCLKQYSKDYVLKRGNKVFPTWKEYKYDNQVFEPFRSHKQDEVENDETDNGHILPYMISSESEDSDEAT